MSEQRWILRNVRPGGGAASDIVVEGDTIVAVVPTAVGETTCRPGGVADASAEVVDGGGMLALPGFINAHAHVDKSWWGQPWQPYGGEQSTQGRIAFERENRDRLGIPSVDGAERVLREFLRHGTTAVRSHVDVDLGLGLRGIEAVREAAARLDGAVQVEIVAFPQDGVIRRPGVLSLLRDAADLGVRNIGGLDPAGIDRDPVAQLDGLFDIVDATGVGLDIHLHDRGELGRFQIELIIDRTLAVGAQGRVNVAHGFALGEVPQPERDRLVERLAEAGVSWSTVAPVGTAPLPWRRMRETGVPIGLGTDGIRDLWNPFGDGDMLRVALAFAQLHGLRFDDDLDWAVRLATTGGAHFVHREHHEIRPGSRADIVLVDAQNTSDALVRAPRRSLVVSGGRVVAQDGEVLIGR